MPFKVFVSYSTKDLSLVRQVNRILADASIQVFVAEHSVMPGDSLAGKIGAAIESCDLFVLLWSKDSVQSPWVQQEVGIALGKKRTILPILLSADLAMPAFLSGIKYLRAHEDVEQALAWLRENVFGRARAKEQGEGLVWLGVGAAILLILSRE